MTRRRPRLLPALAIGLLAVLIVRWLAAEPMLVPTASMTPTLRAGEHVLVDKLAYRFGDPGRGDLVVFRRPVTGELMLKRVVAVGGDSVGLEDGVLHVNGRVRRESFVDYGSVDSVYFGPVRVPRGEFFVMGDLRGDSVDSRSFGPVAPGQLIGRVRLRIWPPRRIAKF